MKYAIGIDIGATKTKAVIANDRGKILIRREIETKAQRKRAAILGDIIKVVVFLKKTAEKRYLKLIGLGVGAPGVMKKGKLIFGGGTLSQFKGLDIAEKIKKETGLRTFADNDAKLFALAESFFGAGKNYSRVAGIVWGTGIGSGFIDKKRKIAKQMEIGHLIVEPHIKNEPKCGCGARGCVENLASGKNIIRRYYAGGGKIKNANVRKIYHSREKIAKKVLEDAYKYMAEALAFLVRDARPEIIVIGGGVSSLPEGGYKKLRNYVYQHALRAKKPKIVKSELGKYAGAIGAAMLVL
jgi:predicted NBD/HSP70 family sugar kinase